MDSFQAYRLEFRCQAATAMALPRRKANHHPDQGLECPSRRLPKSMIDSREGGKEWVTSTP